MFSDEIYKNYKFRRFSDIDINTRVLVYQNCIEIMKKKASKYGLNPKQSQIDHYCEALTQGDITQYQLEQVLEDSIKAEGKWPSLITVKNIYSKIRSTPIDTIKETAKEAVKFKESTEKLREIFLSKTNEEHLQNTIIKYIKEVFGNALSDDDLKSVYRLWEGPALRDLYKAKGRLKEAIRIGKEAL